MALMLRKRCSTKAWTSGLAGSKI